VATDGAGDAAQIDVISVTFAAVESDSDGRAVMFAAAGGGLVVVLLILNALLARRRRISDVDLIASWGVLQEGKVAPDLSEDAEEDVAEEVLVSDAEEEQPTGGGFDWDSV
jgi:hypothetical protein